MTSREQAGAEKVLQEVYLLMTDAISTKSPQALEMHMEDGSILVVSCIPINAPNPLKGMKVNESTAN